MADDAESPQWSRLLSLSVHEFRTPLTVVAGYVRMLLKDRAGPVTDQQRKLLEETEKSCGRLTALLAELSDLARLEGGTVTFNRQPADLRALLRSAIEQLPPLPDREVAVVLEEADGPSMVSADATRLTAALGAVLGALRRELVTSSELFVIERQVAGDPAHRQVLIGDRDTVDATGADASGLPAFDQLRGGCGMSLVIAGRVFDAHEATLTAPPNEHKGGAVIVIPAAAAR
jgi:K+-sensing histidine kinase KdpD